MKKLLAVILALVLALTMLASCQPTDPTKETAATEESGENPSESASEEEKTVYQFVRNTEQPVGTRTSTVSLNGEWELQADVKGKAELYQPTRFEADRMIAFSGIFSMEYDMSSLKENDYAKIKVMLTADSYAETADGAELRVEARVNGHEWIPTVISYYQNGEEHEIDLRADKADFVKGVNLIEIRTNAKDGVYIHAQSAANAAGAVNGEKTGLNYGIFVRVESHQDKWSTCQVPSAAEFDITLSYADEVYPEIFNGIAWYRRSFDVTDLSSGNWWINFNAVDYKCEVFVNGVFIGSHENGYTSFAFSLDEAAHLKEKDNALLVRVIDQDWNNGITEDAVYIKETLAGFSQDTRKLNYMGIWESVWLDNRANAAIGDVYVETKDYETGAVVAHITVSNPTEASLETTVSVASDGVQASDTVTIAGYSSVVVDLPMTFSVPKLWSPDGPNLYELNITAEAGGLTDELTRTFGISHMSVEGNKIYHNGEAVFLTGLLHWGSYYENYTSAVSIERVEKEIRDLKGAGFNAIKFCLYSPPEYVLDACDRLGMFVYIEYPIWNVVETDIFFERAYLQMMEMVKHDRCHPCVVMSDFNCEDLEFTERMAELMEWCVRVGKETDPNRLFTDNSSNGEHRYGDFATCHPYYQVNNFKDMLTRWAEKRGNQPLVLGEYADISVLRDLGEINSQMTEDLSWYHDYLTDTDSAAILRGLGYTEEEIDTVIAESVGNAQDLRKFYLEKAKEVPNVCALFLTHMTESGQGWADGWLDDFYEPHFDSEVIKKAASENTILLNLDSYNFYADRAYTLNPSLSLFGGTDLSDALETIIVTGPDGKVTEKTEKLNLSAGDLYRLPTIDVTFPNTGDAAVFNISISIATKDGVLTQNDWDVHVYPERILTESLFSGKTVKVYDPMNRLKLTEKYPFLETYTGGQADIIIAASNTATLLSLLSNGATVIYCGNDMTTTEVIDQWDFNRLSCGIVLDTTNPLAQAVCPEGFGGVHFMDLATEFTLKANSNAKNIVARCNIPYGTYDSYIQEYTVGEGTLIVTTLRVDESSMNLGGGLLTHESLMVSGENPYGHYIVDALIRYSLELSAE